VDEDDQHSRVVFRGDAMFVPGQKTVSDAIRPVINKAAREIARVGGAVTVTGHTDSQPIHSAEFPSNLVLSEKRAAEVAALLTSGGVPAGRVHIVGKGDTVPVADNGSKAGRAKNRRVEILVVE
ncbi:type VI secretion system protein TssL, partial [Salmonella enterica subsp. enterica serovar Agona]|nr:type VI secretion system protein TssL [Salmonella enterica subsp. enterica serovar Agona]MBJ5118096.1 type VI secretion system protein TssL [Salmonella enterica subsp. enterica serovar Agona]